MGRDPTEEKGRAPAQSRRSRPPENWIGNRDPKEQRYGITYRQSRRSLNRPHRPFNADFQIAYGTLDEQHEIQDREDLPDLEARPDFSGRGPRGYRRPDIAIYENVCDLLTKHPDIDATEIEVHVKDGIVTLAGQLESRRDKRLAENIVDDVAGVVDVNNRIILITQIQE